MMRVQDREKALALFDSLDANGQTLLLLLMLSVRQQLRDTGPAPSLPIPAELAMPIDLLFG